MPKYSLCWADDLQYRQLAVLFEHLLRSVPDAVPRASRALFNLYNSLGHYDPLPLTDGEADLNGLNDLPS